jgi:hypothetical protein
MTRTACFTTHAAKALSRRRTIPIELPEFAIRGLEHRVEMTNPSTRFARSGQAAGADDEEMVSFNDVVEWCLLSALSVKEMPHLEDAGPGFTAAMVRWMIESTYSGPECSPRRSRRTNRSPRLQAGGSRCDQPRDPASAGERRDARRSSSLALKRALKSKPCVFPTGEPVGYGSCAGFADEMTTTFLVHLRHLRMSGYPQTC